MTRPREGNVSPPVPVGWVYEFEESGAVEAFFVPFRGRWQVLGVFIYIMDEYK